MIMNQSKLSLAAAVFGLAAVSINRPNMPNVDAPLRSKVEQNRQKWNKGDVARVEPPQPRRRKKG